MKSKKHIIIRTIIIIFLSLFLGITIYSYNASNLVHNNLPMPFGYGASVVLTGSMEPAISVDDLIIVHQQDSYDIDDIVVYQSQNELIVHRIIDKAENAITTKGDANNTQDEPITADSIKGKVIFNVHYVGRLVNALKSPVGIISVIALAVVLLELSFRSERKKGNDDIEKIKEEIRRLKEN